MFKRKYEITVPSFEIPGDSLHSFPGSVSEHGPASHSDIDIGR